MGQNISELIQERNGGSFTYYLDGRVSSSFVYSSVTYIDILSALKLFKIKCCNIQVIPNHILKKSFLLSPVLAKIINLLVLSGVFQRSSKSALVILMF